MQAVVGRIRGPVLPPIRLVWQFVAVNVGKLRSFAAEVVQGPLAIPSQYRVIYAHSHPNPASHCPRPAAAQRGAHIGR